MKQKSKKIEITKCIACREVTMDLKGWKPVTNLPGAWVCPKCDAWLARG